MISIINQVQRTQTKQELLKATTSHNETFGPWQPDQSLPPKAQALVKDMAASLSEVRENRVQMLREQIAAGTYILDSAEIARNILGL